MEPFTTTALVGEGSVIWTMDNLMLLKLQNFVPTKRKTLFPTTHIFAKTLQLFYFLIFLQSSNSVFGLFVNIGKCQHFLIFANVFGILLSIFVRFSRHFSRKLKKNFPYTWRNKNFFLPLHNLNCLADP
jgi:hypothetical protein